MLPGRVQGSGIIHPDTTRTEGRTLQPIELAHRAVDVLSDRKASNITLLDISSVASFADYFVIAEGTSDRQLRALVESVSDTLEEEDETRPRQIEGTPDSGWVLLDYGDVVVHLFSPEARSFYNLEKIWSTGSAIVKIQ